MKPYLLLLLFTCCSTCLLNAQTAVTHHVSATSTSVHEAPDPGAKVVDALAQYTNVTVLEVLTNGWTKIRFKKQVGYVSQSTISKGKAVLETFTTRTGAMCRDGSTSSATGSGACSRHGGVSYWITGEKTSVHIEGR